VGKRVPPATRSDRIRETRMKKLQNGYKMRQGAEGRNRNARSVSPVLELWPSVERKNERRKASRQQ